MNARNTLTTGIRTRVLAGVLCLVGPFVSVSPVVAAERQFLIMLATSPKQLGADAQLASQESIRKQYFDRTDSAIDSFAEFWEEISYGDVTIAGDVTDWINLPWRIEIDPGAVSTITNDGGIAFSELDGSGLYTYGRPEAFNNGLAQARTDFDGDPNGNPNGPFSPDGGGTHFTDSGAPVYKPGERFVDIDADGSWDALDEITNLMDHNRDGQPDVRGPWLDLNRDTLAENEDDNCVYLDDSDNSSITDFENQIFRDEPDCCPNGPGTVGCGGLAAFPPRSTPPGLEIKVCPPTQWATPDGAFIDCNGNLIPDACDIAMDSADCIALNYFGPAPLIASQDTSPTDLEGNPVGDGIPDECQFSNWDANPSTPQTPGGCAGPASDDVNCDVTGTTCCVRPSPTPPDSPPNRCEFDDSNNDGEIDIVEPWENFLRRWDPCVQDIDANPNLLDDDQIHWIKVYDPISPNADKVLRCADPPAAFSYDDPSYIRDNYPARQSDVDALIRQSAEDPDRLMFGSHDPNDQIGPPTNPDPQPKDCEVDNCLGQSQEQVCAEWIAENFPCLCTSGLPCGPTGNTIGDDNPNIRICFPQNRYEKFNLPADFVFPDDCGGPGEPPCDDFSITDPLPNYCVVGYHHQFDPPDSWTEATPPDDGPEQIASAKVQLETKPSTFCPPTSGICTPEYVPAVRTPEPGTGSPVVDRPWYHQAWSERYNGATAPPWDGGLPGDNLRKVRPYDANGDRRYFAANRGGRNGDGTGWKGTDCGGPLTQIVRFETGDLGGIGFELLCDAPVLPEQVNGTETAGQFWDGWIEYDDLASSKYHRAGDQALGEVTSPGNESIFGQDRGPHIPGSIPDSDGRIAAAGPLAINVHGNGGFDAGNQLHIELLTWRTQPPFNDGEAWESALRFDNQPDRFHPYAGPSGINKGFRDYNLDGLIDLGESRVAGSENYTTDGVSGPNDGVGSQYPWHRSRIVEDCVAVNDRLLDFDDFVDLEALDAVECRNGGTPFSPLPPKYGSGTVTPDGLTSGIVLLPPGSHANDILTTAPRWRPIHNADNDNPAKSFGSGAEKVNFNIFFHTLVRAIDSNSFFEVNTSGAFLTRFAAHEYGHAWQGFPDLYDYDSKSDDAFVLAQENAPIGSWDLMANGGMVHMVPILKENPCTRWIEPVDLRSLLTPGVDATITIPPYETVRDRNAFFLENETILGERYYFYSVGQAMDRENAPNGGMPGRDMLILHTDVGGNPDSLPNGQQNETRINFLIVQADGEGSLESPINAPNFNRGDDSDPWPGTQNKTKFNFNTTPSSTWYTQNAWTGLDVLDVQPDGAGSVRMTVNWQPTNIPSLRFTSPPGGASVNNVFTIAFDATDVHGGTTIELYYTTDPEDITILTNTGPGTGNFIGSMQKTNPGTRRLSKDWNISQIPDGTYFLFAKLIPGQGADGVEVEHTVPIPGRNNVGNGALTINDVNLLRDKSRSETWTLRLVDVLPDGTQDWLVNASLSQPVPADQDPNQDPYPHLFVDPNTHKGQYVSIGEEVTFTLEYDLFPIDLGDTWSFTTTGITAMSRSLTILAGEVDEDPRASIFAIPLAPDPGQTVFFDALESTDPNGAALVFEWDFGDGPADGQPDDFGQFVQHVYQRAGTFTATVKAIDPLTGRFGEAAVDIQVTNNSPNAVLSIDKDSGTAPLTVSFSAGESGDDETSDQDLIYQWDFGDGGTANSGGMPGILAETEHTYIRRDDGSFCEPNDPCTFLAKLTVTDEGGKQAFDTATIVVGNTAPIAAIASSSLQGGDPLTVTFNASNSTDADGQALSVTWKWGDDSPDETLPALTGATGSGDVPHTYTRRAGEDVSQYTMVAEVSDGFSKAFFQATIRVSEAFVPTSQPQADFTISPNPPVVGEPFTVDASNSFDRPDRDVPLAKFEWDWGDGTPNSTGVNATHTYTNNGTFTITLVVSDSEDPPNRDDQTLRLTIGGEDAGQFDNTRPNARITVSPAEAEGFAGVTIFRFSALDSTDVDGDALTYSWFFGDGSPRSTQSEPEHLFEEPGEYRVNLSVTDTSNVSGDAAITITVLSNEGNHDPVPVIGTGPRSGSAPLVLTFNGENSFDPDGDPISYRWEFIKDSILVNSANGAVVTQRFDEQGVFSVILQVDDGRGGLIRSEPEIVTVTARVVDPGGGQVVPGGTDAPATPSPRPFCGFGMLLGAFGSMFGLTIMRLAGRRSGDRRRDKIRRAAYGN